MAIKVIIGDWSYDGSKQKSIEWASGALRSHRSVAVRTGLDAPLLVGMGVPFGVLWRGTRYYRLPHEKGSGASRATDLRRSDSGEGEEIIQSITSLGFVAMLVVPALDHRFGWSALPLWSTLAGDILVAISFLIIFFVYKENTFTSATIQVYPEQRVISTGLYALVRHPMYMGGLFLFAGMCLSLGSSWDFFVFLLMVPALIWRIFDEEKLLARELSGYLEYRNKSAASPDTVRLVGTAVAAHWAASHGVAPKHSTEPARLPTIVARTTIRTCV
jgi:protein-S-isoprenylcysteine O-methyltransferase Ste14